MIFFSHLDIINTTRHDIILISFQNLEMNMTQHDIMSKSLDTKMTRRQILMLILCQFIPFRVFVPFLKLSPLLKATTYMIVHFLYNFQRKCELLI